MARARCLNPLAVIFSMRANGHEEEPHSPTESCWGRWREACRQARSTWGARAGSDTPARQLRKNLAKLSGLVCSNTSCVAEEHMRMSSTHSLRCTATHRYRSKGWLVRGTRGDRDCAQSAHLAAAVSLTTRCSSAWKWLTDAYSTTLGGKWL